MKFNKTQSPSANKSARRGFIKSIAFTTAAIAGGAMIASPQLMAAGQTWKIQSTWDAGTVGYSMFEEWCQGIEEKTGG